MESLAFNQNSYFLYIIFIVNHNITIKKLIQIIQFINLIQTIDDTINHSNYSDNNQFNKNINLLKSINYEK